MKKRLLLLIIVSSLIPLANSFAMEPVPKEEIFNQPRESSFWTILPRDIQEEAWRVYKDFYTHLDEQFDLLMHQKHPKDMYLPSYGIFEDLIKYKGVTLSTWIEHPSKDAPDTIIETRLYQILFARGKFDILKLFVIKNAITDGDLQDAYRSLLFHLNFKARLLNRSQMSLEAKQFKDQCIDFLQTLVRYAQPKFKNYLKEEYLKFKEVYPDLPPLPEEKMVF